MAIYTVNYSGALAANATKSLILINPVPKIKLVHMDISMDASAAAQGVAFELYRVTTLGSPIGTTGTIIKYYANDGAAAATALTNLTTDVTAVEVIQRWYIQPFGGLLPLDAVLDHEVMAPAAGSRLGLRYVNPSGGSTANVAVGISWDE